MPASSACGPCSCRHRGRGKRCRESVRSGKGIRSCFGSGVKGRWMRLIPRAFANVRSSRVVITQSTSRAGSWFLFKCPPCCHQWSVSSSRLASSFLSKHGIKARCHIWEGRILYFLLKTDFSMVPVRACGDFSLDKWGNTWVCVFSA